MRRVLGSGGGRLLLGALAGGFGALSQAPYDLAPFMLAMLAAGFVLWRSCVTVWQACFAGWALGTAYFVVSLRWILEPFQVDAASHGWMAPFALVLLGAGLGLFWAGAFALAIWLRRLGALVLCWTGAELLRAYLFTGFPWASPAQGVLETPLAMGLALVGPYGLTLVLMSVAALAVVPRRAAWMGLGLAGLLLALPGQVGTPEMGEGLVRIVQPNAAQHEKWDPNLARGFVERQLDFTAAAPEGPAPDLVVWPETAIPYLSSVARPVFDWAHAAAGGVPVLMGVQRDDPAGRFHNSAMLIGQGGQVQATYDKHHLVPFGEYMPFPALFRSLGIRALAVRAERGYSPGPGPQLMDLGALGQALILICYEAVFPQDMRSPSRPDLIIQLTNDAWFGQSLGPQQHLALARMRAIEQGLPLVRSANTGISAMIGPRGTLLAQLDLNTAGYLDARLPRPLPPTPYARTGDLPLTLLLLAGIAVLTFRRLQH